MLKTIRALLEGMRMLLEIFIKNFFIQNQVNKLTCLEKIVAFFAFL